MERKPRYAKPTNPDSVNFHADQAKLEILQVVYEMEFVRTSIIRKLLPHRHVKGINFTFDTMHRAGLLDKIVTNTNQLCDPDIYTLTDKGLKLLEERAGLPDFYVRTYTPRGTGVRKEFAHSMMISDMIGSVRAGAIDTGCRIISQGEIEREFMGKVSEDPIKLPATIEAELKGVHRTWSGDIEPDGLYGIEYPDGTVSFFAVEEQNTGTVRCNVLQGRSSMLRKLLAYADISKNKTYKTAWGIPNLRVLFRFAHLDDYTASVKLATELFGKSPMFLFVHEPAFKTSKTGLLLAPEPMPRIITDKWTRAGMEPIALYEKEPRV